MLENIKIRLKKYSPKIIITNFIGWLANLRLGMINKIIIYLFIKYYHIDMSNASHQEISYYKTFNQFFTRALRDEKHPINLDPNILVCPVDGEISQLGYIENNKIFQAKGHYYTLDALLAGKITMIKLFRHGNFVTIYLSPQDYHRVHMPCNGVLREMIYVPGTLFSVNPCATHDIPNLFARNERIICLFDTQFGPLIQIMVGATLVGSIETIWHGTITPPRDGIIKYWSWPAFSKKNPNQSIRLFKGQEMGQFKLGSTVINLFTPNRVKLVEHLRSKSITRIGQPLAISTITIDN
ncbi:MAG: archaetidylserine decarboxylase [Candidatus Dasytiphilus stammeri]